MIRGARQVGKSTLVRDFARARSLRLVEVNLEQHRALEPVFRTLDVSPILAELEAISGVSPAGRNALVFLDEIQATPSALAALRYLFEQRPDIAVIGAGSLLEFVLRSHEFSMPVGRIEYLHLGPMMFGEFLLAVGDGHLARLLDGMRLGEPLARSAHQKLLRRQREYLLVGGMPEAVAEHASGSGFIAVADVHRAIAATYRDDFAKYGSTSASLLRCQRVFDYVPGAVGTKIKYANISRDERAREVRTAIEMLSLARVIWRVHHSDCSGLPLQAQVDPNIYKCLFLDVGLMSHMCGLDWSSVASPDERRLVNEGGLAEQFIGQHLLFREGGLVEPFLGYWLREGKHDNAEVDYVISQGGRIVPIEVKAGTAGSLKSLHQFVARKLQRGGIRRPIVIRFNLNPPSLTDHSHKLSHAPETSVHFTMLSLPLYLVEQTLRLVQEL